MVLHCDLGGNSQSLEKMVITTIVNHTQKSIYLKEGNGNLTIKCWDLESNKSEKLVIDPNATYRTFIIFCKGVDNMWASLELNSDYCCDYKQVHVCMDSAQKMFFGSLPRNSKMKKKNIRNECDTNIVLTAVISGEDIRDVATVELAQLAPRNSTWMEAFPESGHWKYFVQMVNDSNEKIEITDHFTTQKTKLVVTFTSSDRLCCVPKKSMLDSWI